MVPFSRSRSAHVATNTCTSNHMMRSITTNTCLLKQCYLVCILFLESNRTGKENFKLHIRPLVKLADMMNVET